MLCICLSYWSGFFDKVLWYTNGAGRCSVAHCYDILGQSLGLRRLRPFINSAWRSLSSLFIFYGMVATRGLVIYTRGMVDDTEQIRKSCNVRRLFHCGIRYLSPAPKTLFPIHDTINLVAMCSLVILPRCFIRDTNHYTH